MFEREVGGERAHKGIHSGFMNLSAVLIIKATGIGYPGTGVLCSCEWPKVLCRSSKYSQWLSHLSSPSCRARECEFHIAMSSLNISTNITEDLLGQTGYTQQCLNRASWRKPIISATQNIEVEASWVQVQPGQLSESSFHTGFKVSRGRGRLLRM